MKTLKPENLQRAVFAAATIADGVGRAADFMPPEVLGCLISALALLPSLRTESAVKQVCATTYAGIEAQCRALGLPKVPDEIEELFEEVRE